MTGIEFNAQKLRCILFHAQQVHWTNSTASLPPEHSADSVRTASLYTKSSALQSKSTLFNAAKAFWLSRTWAWPCNHHVQGQSLTRKWMMN